MKLNYNNQEKQNDDNYKWKQVREYERQFDKNEYLIVKCGNDI